MDTGILDGQAFIEASTSLTFKEGTIILILALLYGLYLRAIYYRYAITFSSKFSFGNTLLMVTISVASLVAVVKASLALSLGLVGALSVIRFRTAVKEPYNLSFILLSIAIAISIGASQYLFTLLVAIVGTLCIYLSYRSTTSSVKNAKSKSTDDIDSIFLTLPSTTSFDDINKLLTASTSYYSFLSIDQEDREPISMVINIKLKDNDSLYRLKESIFTNFPGSSFKFYNTPDI